MGMAIGIFRMAICGTLRLFFFFLNTRAREKERERNKERERRNKDEKFEKPGNKTAGVGREFETTSNATCCSIRGTL